VEVGRRGFGHAERVWRFLGVGMEGLRGVCGVLCCGEKMEGMWGWSAGLVSVRGEGNGARDVCICSTVL
jgi:hypothetical protein